MELTTGTREEWLAAREKLLVKEKEVTRARDALAAERRRLPMLRIEKDYVFAGPERPHWTAAPHNHREGSTTR